MPALYQEPKSCFDMEMQALQGDFAEMVKDMRADIKRVETYNIATYKKDKAEWESELKDTKAKFDAEVQQFQKDEANAAQAYQQNALELERLNEAELNRLKARVPRPERDPPPQPQPRPHRMDPSRMQAPPVVPPRFLEQARQVLAWLGDSGLQQQHAQGYDFWTQLLETGRPAPLQHASDTLLLKLHITLSTTPATQWPTLAPTIARILNGLGSATAATPTRPSVSLLERFRALLR